MNFDKNDPLDWAPYVAALLDRCDGGTREAIGWRILKLSEETGEAAAAWIGYVGQNPRKGVTHTLDDVARELGDVVFTALVALASLGVDLKVFIPEYLAHQRTRLPAYLAAAKKADSS